MTTRLPALCDSCIHKGPTDGLTGRFPCNAFPSGVPLDIIRGEFDHRTEHPLDNGLTYDMLAGQEDTLDLHLEIVDTNELNFGSGE